jgi:mono/diheme cytochrome c family protein
MRFLPIGLLKGLMFLAASLFMAPLAHAQGTDVSRGTYLAILGDCAGCHSVPHQPAYSGGLPFTAAFGTLYSTNITPDVKTGIGSWTADQFYRALHQGIAADGSHLYPAFPYPYLAELSRADTNDLFAFLKSQKPVVREPTPNKLIFPFNIRMVMMLWNWLFLKDQPFRPDPAQSAQWNRGKFLVTGPGHCAACHTPKNLMFGDEHENELTGTVLDNWFAANLTNDKTEGLGNWTAAEIDEYLTTGRNAHATAAGSMLDKVTGSTSRMTEPDRQAIAVYLKSLPPHSLGMVLPVSPAQMVRGQAVFTARCVTCHKPLQEVGALPDYPQLAGNTSVVERGPTSVLRVILEGGPSLADASLHKKPMPPFAKLSDGDIADVASYVRNAWGNRASPVSATDVHILRRSIAATPGG